MNIFLCIAQQNEHQNSIENTHKHRYIFIQYSGLVSQCKGRNGKMKKVISSNEEVTAKGIKLFSKTVELCYDPVCRL